MRDQDILLSINPFHLELLRPLVKWKILSIKEIFEDSKYPASYKTFHKIIQRLEKHGVIKSFKDVWTKTKRIYLTRQGNELVNPNDWLANCYSETTLFHDSRVTLYLRFLAQNLPVSWVNLEQEQMRIRHKEDFQRIRPDAEFGLETNGKRESFILEIELTQKDKERAWEKILHYKSISDYKNILFVFPNPTIYQCYLRILKDNEDQIGKHNYIFVLDEGLTQGAPSLEKSKAYYKGQEVSFGKVMDEIMMGISSDYKTNVGRIWRQSFEKLF